MCSRHTDLSGSTRIKTREKISERPREEYGRADVQRVALRDQQIPNRLS